MTLMKEKSFGVRQLLNKKDSKTLNLFAPLIDQVTGLAKLNKSYEALKSSGKEGEDFVDTALDYLGVDFSFDLDELNKMPREGATIVVANHPFGVHDSLLMVRGLQATGRKFKILANNFFGAFEELNEHLLLLDVFQRDPSSNRQALREAIAWLREGNVLAVFPAGAVSRLNLKNREVVDPEWNDIAARLHKMTEAPVLPVHFSGRNSWVFQLAGLANSRIATMRLAKEATKSKEQISVHVGELIEAKELVKKGSYREMTDYLRMRCYLLGEMSEKQCLSSLESTLDAIIDPVAKEVMFAEVESLAEQRLLEYNDFDVYYARAEQIPNTLKEIGRLREETFRAVGEGTGQAVDLDEYDQHYLHLFVWNRKEHELLGAYRMGEVDTLTEHGQALYTAEFYKYSRSFLKDYGSSLEMGRSFVQQKYQRKPYSLLLLWRGICHYIAKYPKYRYLFGAVSVSNEYCAKSRAVMAHLLQDSEASLKSRMPVKIRMMKEVERYCKEHSVSGSDELSYIVKSLEDDGKDIPVLIKQYMKLGGKFLSFSVDKDFGNTLDGLIVVDLPKAPAKSLQMFMGDKMEAYVEKWGE